MKVFILSHTTWSSGYDHDTQIIAVYESLALAEFFKKPTHSNDDGGESYDIKEFEILDKEQVIKNFVADLESVQVEEPVMDFTVGERK